MAGPAGVFAVTHAVGVCRATITVGMHSNLVLADSLPALFQTCPPLREHARQARKESKAAHASCRTRARNRCRQGGLKTHEHKNHAYAHRRAGLARGAVMPRGGWLREVRRWACCGLRRTGGPSPGFWGVFIIAVHRAFVLGLGARHRGIVELSEDRCV